MEIKDKLIVLTLSDLVQNNSPTIYTDPGFYILRTGLYGSHWWVHRDYDEKPSLDHLLGIISNRVTGGLEGTYHSGETDNPKVLELYDKVFRKRKRILNESNNSACYTNRHEKVARLFFYLTTANFNLEDLSLKNPKRYNRFIIWDVFEKQTSIGTAVKTPLVENKEELTLSGDQTTLTVFGKKLADEFGKGKAYAMGFINWTNYPSCDIDDAYNYYDVEDAYLESDWRVDKKTELKIQKMKINPRIAAEKIQRWWRERFYAPSRFFKSHMGRRALIHFERLLI